MSNNISSENRVVVNLRVKNILEADRPRVYYYNVAHAPDCGWKSSKTLEVFWRKLQGGLHEVL